MKKNRRLLFIITAAIAIAPALTSKSIAQEQIKDNGITLFDGDLPDLKNAPIGGSGLTGGEEINNEPTRQVKVQYNSNTLRVEYLQDLGTINVKLERNGTTLMPNTPTNTSVIRTTNMDISRLPLGTYRIVFSKDGVAWADFPKE
ncbi:MAG: hypothetical protein ACLVKO_03315 [Dysgonomonas sp.]